MPRETLERFNVLRGVLCLRHYRTGDTVLPQGRHIHTQREGTDMHIAILPTEIVCPECGRHIRDAVTFVATKELCAACAAHNEAIEDNQTWDSEHAHKAARDARDAAGLTGQFEEFVSEMNEAAQFDGDRSGVVPVCGGCGEALDSDYDCRNEWCDRSAQFVEVSK